MRTRRNYREELQAGGAGAWPILLLFLLVISLLYFKPDLRALVSDLAEQPAAQSIGQQIAAAWQYVQESAAQRLPPLQRAEEDTADAGDDAAVIAAQAALPALQPVDIEYIRAEYGQFIFSNNPEQLRAEDLADKDQGGVLLYQAEVSGATQVFAEHLNMVVIEGEEREITFGMQLYNPNEVELKVRVERMGRSIGDWQGDALWKQFLQPQPQEIVLAPKGMQWLFIDKAIPYGQVFDAALAIQVGLDSKLEINLAAFTNLKKLDGKAVARPLVEREESDGQQTSRVYSGRGDYPLLSCHMQWRIDDTVATNSYLPVRYGGQVRDYWISHDNKNTEAIRTDIIPLQIRYAEGERTLDAWSSDESGRSPNLANWGVQYAHTLRLENSGSRERVLQYLVEPAHTATQKQTLLAWLEGSALQSYHYAIDSAAASDEIPLVLWEAVLKPGESVERTVFLILAAQSHGGVKHSLRIVE